MISLMYETWNTELIATENTSVVAKGGDWEEEKMCEGGQKVAFQL